MRVMLKGLHRVRSRGRVYYYAWRGGPRIFETPGTPEFAAEFARLTEARRKPDLNLLAGLVTNYRRKELHTKAPDTQRSYGPILDEIVTVFGDMPIAAIEELGSRAVFEDWRDSKADRPRTADLCWTVLRRVFSFSVTGELLKRNPCEGGSGMPKGSRRELIWTDAEIATMRARAPKQVVEAMTLALETGQRQGDVLRLKWTAYDGTHIRLKQSKGGKNVTIRVSGELKAMLDSLPRDAVTILTNSKGTPWTGSGFRASWRKAMRNAGITGRTFHDLRGTFITRAKRAGATDEEIRHASGHSQKTVTEILETHYLATDTEVSDAVILKLERAKP